MCHLHVIFFNLFLLFLILFNSFKLLFEYHSSCYCCLCYAQVLTASTVPCLGTAPVSNMISDAHPWPMRKGWLVGWFVGSLVGCFVGWMDGWMGLEYMGD